MMARRWPAVRRLPRRRRTQPPQEGPGDCTCFDDQNRTPLLDHQQHAWIEAQWGWRVEVVGPPPKPRGLWAPLGAVIDRAALRPQGVRGVLPRRWVVARPFSWCGQGRRLSRGDERSAHLHDDDAVDAAALGPCLTFSDSL